MQLFCPKALSTICQVFHSFSLDAVILISTVLLVNKIFGLTLQISVWSLLPVSLTSDAFSCLGVNIFPHTFLPEFTAHMQLRAPSRFSRFLAPFGNFYQPLPSYSVTAGTSSTRLQASRLLVFLHEQLVFHTASCTPQRLSWEHKFRGSVNNLFSSPNLQPRVLLCMTFLTSSALLHLPCVLHRGTALATT